MYNAAKFKVKVSQSANEAINAINKKQLSQDYFLAVYYFGETLVKQKNNKNYEKALQQFEKAESLLASQNFMHGKLLFFNFF